MDSQESVKRLVLSVVGRRRRGSPATANAYVTGVRKLSGFLGMEPDAVIEEVKANRIDLAQRINAEGTGFIDTQLNSGAANKTVWSMLAGVKRWLEVNEASVDWNRIERPSAVPVKNRDRAPTPAEIKKLLNLSDVKERAILSLLATSGLRVGTCLSLRWGELDFARPDVVKVTVSREEGRKFGRLRDNGGEPESFTTFGSTNTRSALLAYRRSLEEQGRTTEEVAYAFPPLRGDQTRHMSVSSFLHRYHSLLAQAELNERSVDHYVLHIHTWRKYFRSRSVGLDASIREYMMGHRGGYLDPSYLRLESEALYKAYAETMPRLEVDVAEGEDEARALKRQVAELRVRLEETGRGSDSRVADLEAKNTVIEAKLDKALKALETIYEKEKAKTT
jgi:integrase